MSLNTDDYNIWYEEDTKVIYMEGKLRLNSSDDYAEINKLIEETTATDGKLSLNLTELEFLNSSGINVLYKHVLMAKKKGVVMKVEGSKRLITNKVISSQTFCSPIKSLTS